MEKREIEAAETGSGNSSAGSSSSSSFMSSRAFIDDDEDNIQYPGSEMNGADNED